MDKWILVGTASFFALIGAFVLIASRSDQTTIFEGYGGLDQANSSNKSLSEEESTSVGSAEQTNQQNMPEDTQAKNLPKPEKVTINTEKTYQVTLKTSEGDILIQLDTEETPITSNNFVYLAENDFYDNTIFHRVIDGFMIQGGDPTGTGMGSPGYRFDDEPVTKEYKRGTVAMANSGKNTNGSQFFIMHADYPLPKNYVIFGQVIEGLDVVDKIATAEVTSGFSGENSTPVKPVTIQDVTIEVK